MRRIFLLALVILASALSVIARGKVQGTAVVSQTATTAGLNSTNKFTRVLASATVTVYCPTATTTLCTLYSDRGGTAKANPFTAGSDGSYSFYTDAPAVDVRFSGVTGVPAFTISDVPVVSGDFTSNVVCNGTADATAIQTAVNSLTRGTVYLSGTTCALGSTTVTDTQYVHIKGQGSRGTILSYSGTSYALKFGNSASVYSYGMGASDLEILLTNTAGGGIYVLGSWGADFSNIYIEGVPGGATKGVLIESSIYGTWTSVRAHVTKFGWKLIGTAPHQSTTQTFTNCSADAGAVLAGSIGFECDADSGESVWNNGNFEDMDTAIYLNGAHGMKFYAPRFETNGTWDVNITSLAYGNLIDGAINLDLVQNNAGAGFNSDNITNNIKSTGAPVTNLIVGASNIVAFTANDTPLKLNGFPAQNVDVLTIADSSNTAMVGVNKSLCLYVGATGTPLCGYHSATASLTFSWAGSDCQTATMTVTGAVTGDTVALGLPDALGSIAGIGGWYGWVSSAGVVSVRACKTTAGASAPGAQTVRASTWHH